MRTSKLVLSFVLLAFGAGCGPTPEKVCKRLEELEAKSEKKKDKKKKKDDDCVDEMKKMKEKKPETFKCIATCSEMSDYDNAMMCVFACALKDMKDDDKDKKSKKDDDDDKKSKKSSDDDDDKAKKKKSSDDDDDKAKKKKSDDDD